MENLKFRFWDKNKKIFSNNWPIADSFFLINLNELVEVYSSREFEISQFAWIRDKNGKEIYEWDIISTYDGRCLVSFCRGQFTLQTIYSNWIIKDEHYVFFPSGNNRYLLNMEWTTEDISVIGNKRENTELM
jgi:hypothetical protein